MKTEKFEYASHEKDYLYNVSYNLYVAGFYLYDEDGEIVKIITEYKVTDIEFNGECAPDCAKRLEKSVAYVLETLRK
jgi:hypothetical protein